MVNNFVSERASEIGDNILIKNEEYSKNINKVISLYKDIEKYLPEEVMYAQGLRDGLGFEKMLAGYCDAG